MYVDQFDQQIEDLSWRLTVLQQRTKESPLQQQQLVAESLEELRTALEELQVAQEELRQQNEELAAARQMVEAERQRYQDLFEFAPDGYLVTDASGTIREANRAAASLLNVSQQFLEGKPLAIFVAESERLAFYSELTRLRRENRVQEWQVCLQPHHGDKFDAALTVATVRDRGGKGVALRVCVRDITNRKRDEAGNLLGFSQIMRDMTSRKQAETERKQLEAALRQQAEQLAQANRMKDEFLATLSHELRTPLNSILNWSQLLRTRKFNESTTARALETIERNAKAQFQLIKDLLDVSRIIQGQIRLDVRPVSLVSVIQAAINTVSLAAAAKAIQLEFVLDSSNPSPLLVSGDANRLQQIVWNLLCNAVKFTPEGGRVEVRLERVNSQAQIKVSDTGKGISADFLPYVFDRFRQFDSSLTRSYGGLGLGLAIVRHLVELHGGTVHAESPGEGQGATFTVNLPAKV